jgi:short-subunit dehydrogenase
MKNLRGKNVLLTGASGGLGPYVGRALAAQGANLALTGRATGALEATAKEVGSLGVRTTAIPADLTDQASRERLVQQATAQMGTIDVLVNNAGMEWVARYTSLSPAYIETMIQTNLVAPLILARLLLPDMLQRGSGHIVMMSSLGGKKGSPYSATYAGTKAALIEWTAACSPPMASALHESPGRRRRSTSRPP